MSHEKHFAKTFEQQHAEKWAASYYWDRHMSPSIRTRLIKQASSASASSLSKTLTEPAVATAIGATALGAGAGIRAHQRHKRKGGKESIAVYEARRRLEDIKSREQRGQKVSKARKRLAEIQYSDALKGEKDPGRAALVHGGASAIAGGLAGYGISRAAR